MINHGEKKVNICTKFSYLGQFETNDSLEYDTIIEACGYKDVKDIYFDETRNFLVDKDGNPLKSWPPEGMRYKVTGSIISFEMMIELMAEMREKGATHFSIMPHEDHRSYIIDYGVMKPIDEAEKEVLLNNQKQLYKQRLQADIDFHEQEIEKIKKRMENA